MTWLRNEDQSLKTKLSGIKVTDANAPAGGRPVAVRFVDPELELAKLSFPCILIQPQEMVRAEDREHRGVAPIAYWPEGRGRVDDSRDDPTKAPLSDFAIPMDIPYQITVLARRQDHRTQITAALSSVDYLPVRFGWVEVIQDGTIRSLFVDGGPEYEATKDLDGKRLLMSHYRIRIPTEIPPTVPAINTVSTVSVSTDLK